MLFGIFYTRLIGFGASFANMAYDTPSSAPHGPDSSGGSEKNQPDLEKREEVADEPPRSSTSEHEDDNNDVQDPSNPLGQDLERTSTLGTVLGRLRSRGSAVIEPPPDGGLVAWMVGECSDLYINHGIDAKRPEQCLARTWSSWILGELSSRRPYALAAATS